MNLYLHRYDERDIDRGQIAEVCRCLFVYSCHEDEYRVVYLFDEYDLEYAGEIREAA